LIINDPLCDLYGVFTEGNLSKIGVGTLLLCSQSDGILILDEIVKGDENDVCDLSASIKKLVQCRSSLDYVL
jgi:hypothetical protein